MFLVILFLCYIRSGRFSGNTYYDENGSIVLDQNGNIAQDQNGLGENQNGGRMLGYTYIEFNPRS